jgi:hypothetical protein
MPRASELRVCFMGTLWLSLASRDTGIAVAGAEGEMLHTRLYSRTVKAAL